ncbi:hypothetical protein MHYP_G00044160 [Metynnis hypsauchen]
MKPVLNIQRDQTLDTPVTTSTQKRAREASEEESSPAGIVVCVRPRVGKGLGTASVDPHPARPPVPGPRASPSTATSARLSLLPQNGQASRPASESLTVEYHTYSSPDWRLGRKQSHV